MLETNATKWLNLNNRGEAHGIKLLWSFGRMLKLWTLSLARDGELINA